MIDTGNSGNLTIKSIRDYILDNELGQNDTIVLNSLNFDDIILEYRQVYDESAPNPFYFLKVLIAENYKSDRVKLDKIRIVKNDTKRTFEDYIPLSKRELKFSDLDYSDKIIYRCGYCGNVVDSDGTEFTENTKNHKIRILEKFERLITQEMVHGKCCPNGNNE